MSVDTARQQAPATRGRLPLASICWRSACSRWAAVLALFGVGAFIGLSIGGRIADRRPSHALLAGALGIVAASVLLALLARQALAVVPIVLLLGIAGFVQNPAIYARVFTIASDAPTLAGATTVSAFQLGISLVPALAATALDAGAGITSLAWIGAGLAVAVVPTVLLDRTPSRRPDGGRTVGIE